MQRIARVFGIVVGCAVASVATTGRAVGACPPQEPTSDWTQVHRMQGGTATVTRHSGSAIAGVVAVVDEARLVLVTPADAVSSGDWKYVLDKAKSRWDGVAMGTDRVTGRGRIEISREGLFQGGRKVASWTSIAREDVVEIRGTVRKRGGLRGAIIGAAVGTGAGFALYYAGAYLNNESGGGDGAITAGIVIPIVAPFVGYFASSHEERFLYRPTASSPLPLDDATWRRVRAALPASLRGELR